ncbi:MAG: hypothetical protein EXR79_06060 [Myxococcales bacterium]|nr:hypothetical protein [Myxococcales bacterium]
MRQFFHPLLTLALLAATACAAEPGAEAGDGAELVPASAATLFDQAAVCDNIFKRHTAIREADLRDGVLRWGCGDVPGVTGKDLGQEYCEYKAMQGGKVVRSGAELKSGQKLSCVFSSVYMDCNGWGVDNTSYAGDLAKDMSKPENLNATVDATAMVMKVGFNSRAAAEALIKDCAANAKKSALNTKQLVNEERQAACYEASTKNTKEAAKLRTLCRSTKGDWLADEKKWTSVKALGARIAVAGEANFEWQRDLTACLRTGDTKIKGVTWRNSDPMICSRVVRAAAECDAKYVSIPLDFKGFVFTGWTNRQVPAGCRKAKRAGADYDNMVICDATTSELEDIGLNPTFSSDLNEFCRTRFAKDLVMQAPLRLLTTSATSVTPFCKAYSGK